MLVANAAPGTPPSKGGDVCVDLCFRASGAWRSASSGSFSITEVSRRLAGQLVLSVLSLAPAFSHGVREVGSPGPPVGHL